MYPLPYCGHRWCENEDCLIRADLIWLPLTKFIKHLKLLPKSKQPAGKSYPILVTAIEDKLIQAKMKLVEYISSKLNVFLRGFQTDQPMVPFLCEALERLLRLFMSMFILGEVMSNANTLMKLLKVQVTDKGLYKPLNTIDIGLGAKMRVTEYKKSSNFKEGILNEFWKGAQITLSSLVVHFMEKSPLKFPLVRLLILS